MERGYMEEAECWKERTPPGGRAAPSFTKQSFLPTCLNISVFIRMSELNELTVQVDGRGSTKKTGIPECSLPTEAWFLVISSDEQLANWWRLNLTKTWMAMGVNDR
ncbi:Annexin [Psidium guajava]|nr:Annexin [Psidium guajava]